jgi:phosphoribosyl 1,2-cyclic phosphodiesterase
MRFASLGSGSKGNATLVQAGETVVMVDCGFSVRETTRRLERFGLTPGQLDAILVTHEHSDHCSGVAALSRKFEIPVYMTHGTQSSGRCDNCFQTLNFTFSQNFTVGALEVEAVAVPHDAKEPSQYRFFCGGKSVGVLTDLGSVTEHVVERYRSCDALMLELNHVEELLRWGVYPHHLKRRVGGDWGHLNNAQAASLLEEINHSGLRHLVVAHISEKNNTRELAEQALMGVLPSLDCVVWADQANGFDWLIVE